MAVDLETVLTEINGTRPVLEQIANKWSVLILAVLCTHPLRFNAIKRRLDPITQKALTEALRRLERNGLVRRHVISSSPIAVEYSITPLGETLRDPFTVLIAWAKAHGQEVGRAQEAFDALAPEVAQDEARRSAAA